VYRGFFLWIGKTLNTGYALLFNPPIQEGHIISTVDVGMLLTQWTAVVLIEG
jgi:hypothetical protein